MKLPRIIVDADACPVKTEIIEVAERHDLEVVFVANSGMRPSRNPKIRQVTVGSGFDAADNWIADNIETADIVITADVPLAARCVEKGAFTIGPSGKEFKPDNIGISVAIRDLNQTLRETGAISGHNAAFSRKARSSFLQALESAIRRAVRQLEEG